MVEQRTENPCVGSSILPLATTPFIPTAFVVVGVFFAMVVWYRFGVGMYGTVGMMADGDVVGHGDRRGFALVVVGWRVMVDWMGKRKISLLNIFILF